MPGTHAAVQRVNAAQGQEHALRYLYKKTVCTVVVRNTVIQRRCGAPF